MIDCLTVDDLQWFAIIILCVVCMAHTEFIAQLRGYSNVLLIKNTLIRIFRWAFSVGATGKHAKEKVR